jgi:hypothetical protein
MQTRPTAARNDTGLDRLDGARSTLVFGLLFFFHLLADDLGVTGFGIDFCLQRQAAAGDGIGVLLFGHDAVLNDFGVCGRHLAAKRRWWWRRCRRLFGTTTAQQETAEEQQTLHT